MSEKKQVLYDLRMAYSGPFAVEDFYAEVDSWIKEKGHEKENKRKMESITKSGRKIYWVIEAISHLDDLHHGVIVVKASLDNVKEIVVKKNGKKMKANSGDALIEINAFLESHIHGSFFNVKPIYYFVRALIDKYIYNFWSNKYDGVVNADARDLFKRIQSFFNLQKYKYE